MDSNNKPINGYNSGADFWRDNAVSYGTDEAVVICSRYLDMDMRRELSDDERRFCREIFAAMYEDMAKEIVLAKLVYPYDLKTANDRAETSCFYKNQKLNQECARSIDEAICASNYSVNHYNIELAAMFVIRKYGFERVNTLLAHHIKEYKYDVRYAEANKHWARNIRTQNNNCPFMNAHATLIDDVVSYTRRLYTDLGAERFTLFGQEEHGELEPVHGYEIIRSIMFAANQGYAIGHNPNAVSPYVCWHFMINGGKRDYCWGIYGDEQAAIDGYNARLFVAVDLSNEGRKPL